MVIGVEGASFGSDVGLCFALFNTSAGFPLSGVDDADASKWTARFDGVAYRAFAVKLIAFDRLRLKFNAVGPQSGANALSYSNAPSDISDTRGRALGAFSGFPV